MKIWNSIKFHIKEFFLVYCREFKLVIHDGGLVLFFLFIPFAYPIIYSLIYNPELVRDVRIVAVDHDRTSASRELVRQIDACQEARLIGYAADLDEARRAMDEHECYGILEIPEGFARKIGRGETAQAVMYCEMSLLLRYRGLLVAATNVTQELGAQLQQRKIEEIAPLAATLTDGDLLPMHNVSMGNITGGFDSFILPAVLVLILHQCLILVSGMAGGAKVENRHLIGYDSFNSAPSVAMSMLGQMLCFMTIILVPMLFLLHYVPLMFRFPMEADPLDLIVFIIPMVIACLGVGFILQGFVWERESVFPIWVITSVAFLFLSGITWPRYAMHGPWLWLSDIIPGTWGVEGFVKMSTNGASLAQVREPYINLWILAGVYLVIGFLVQKFIVRPRIMATHPCGEFTKDDCGAK